MFNEITKKAVLEALEHPGDIDMKMVDAQQARRVLDRLVGYKISPLLWDKVRRGLTAGRVQSVALKLICDREREIERVRPRGVLEPVRRGSPARSRRSSTRKLLKKDGANIKVGNEDEVERGPRRSRSARRGSSSSVTTKERKKQRGAAVHHQQAAAGVALPGQEDDDDRAAALRRASSCRARGAVGLITYMRTDSTRVSDQALDRRARVHRRARSAPTIVPEKPNVYKTKTTRRTRTKRSVRRRCSTTRRRCAPYLTPDQYYLYQLIWNRFVASQMPPAMFDETTVDITAADYLFRVKGSVPKFAGWLAVYGQRRPRRSRASDGAPAPGPRRGDGRRRGRRRRAAAARGRATRSSCSELKPEQKFTQPPPRFTEATLVKALEENGIGRPSTYASIISVLQARDYVNKIEGRFKPTILGAMLVEKLLQPGVRRHPRRRTTRASSKRSSTRSRRARPTT